MGVLIPTLFALLAFSPLFTVDRDENMTLFYFYTDLAGHTAG